MSPKLITTCLAALLASMGCGAPGMVEGVFASDPFSLRVDDPLARAGGSQRDMLVVMADPDGETLRTVAVGLNHFNELPLGKPVKAGTGAIDDDRPFVEVTVGTLTREDRGDGVEVISSVDPERANSVGGTITIEDLAPEVVGSFHVELDDGGWLEGSFVARPTE